MRAHPIPILTDNYAWLLHDEATGVLGVVDPGDSAPVLAVLSEQGAPLDAILLTHHHDDHTNGVAGLRQCFPNVRVIGARADQRRLPDLSEPVDPGDTIHLGASAARVIDTPGHTLGHISFFFEKSALLFCGDTLFSLGCGRLLEGDAAQMFASLRTLAALPGDTLVCCGHEYTESNARFALTIDPKNRALQDKARAVAVLRAALLPSLPSLLREECAANPFLRTRDVAAFARLRREKDGFSG